MSEDTKVVEFIPREDWEKALEQAADGRSLPATRSLNKKFTRQQVVDSFAQAFETIGGVPRLAHWADSHPTDFYKLYARLLPTAAQQQLEHSGEITIKHVLPRGPLDE